MISEKERRSLELEHLDRLFPLQDTLTVDQVAHLCQLSKAAIYDAINFGKLRRAKNESRKTVSKLAYLEWRESLEGYGR